MFCGIPFRPRRKLDHFVRGKLIGSAPVQLIDGMNIRSVGFVADGREKRGDCGASRLFPSLVQSQVEGDSSSVAVEQSAEFLKFIELKVGVTFESIGIDYCS